MNGKLKIEELDVESFVVSQGAGGGRGTVEGNQIGGPTIRNTCVPDLCSPTFAFSCGYPEGQCPK